MYLSAFIIESSEDPELLAKIAALLETNKSFIRKY